MPTAEPHILGGHKVECQSCNAVLYSWNSCGDTNCPQCQSVKKEEWIDKMTRHLLPVEHFHLIFTIPSELRDCFFYNQRVAYNALFRSAWIALQQVLGGQTGMVVTLHSWGSNLSYHPHVHCIVPAGYYKGNKWIDLGKQKLVESKVLRAAYKKELIRQLIEAADQGVLTWEGEQLEQNPSLYHTLSKTIRKATDKNWTVRIERPILGVEQIIQYLSRYVRRVAISNSRIENITDTHVTINYKQYAKQEKGKAAPVDTMEFEGTKFIQRFAQHIPPFRFHKVRYYGCYAFSAKNLKSSILLAIGKKPTLVPIRNRETIIEGFLGHALDVCKQCGSIGDFVTTKINNAPQAGYFLTPRRGQVFSRAGPKQNEVAVACF